MPLDPNTTTRAQYDAQPWEFRALRDQRRYVMIHPNEFPKVEGQEQSELEVLNERIHEAIAEMRHQRKRENTEEPINE